jgi:4-amino-4-deoxy-L-arabinose transferase-like glycosyltransferase
LFAFSLLIYLLNNHGFSIYILDEAKNAECAREMLEQRSFFVPLFNSVLRTDKPPLHYFFMMLSYRIFGVNAFAARFFSAIFGALTILITYLFAKKNANKYTAFWSSVVLLSSLHLALQFRLAVPDPYLIFFFTATLFFFYSALKKQNSKYVWLMYISIGLGTLSKGPVAILLPGLIFLLFLIFSKSFTWKNIAFLKPLWGILLVLCVAAPWFIINGLKTNWEWTYGFFMEHNIQRYSETMESHGGIFLLSFLYVFLGMLPFAVFLPQALFNAIKRRKEPLTLFCIIAALSIVGFFSLSHTKLINYTVPAYPFLAIILGKYFSEKVKAFKRIRIAFYILLVITMIVPIIALSLLKETPSFDQIANVVLFLMIMPLGLCIAWILRRDIHKFLLAFASSFLLTALVCIIWAFPLVDKQNPVYKSRDLIQNKPVVYYRKYDAAYLFELKREVKEIGKDDFSTFLHKHPDGIIITTRRKIKDIELPPNCEVIFSSKNIFENTTTVLLGRK